MHQNRFWNLLAKHLSGEASAGESMELESLIKKHPELSFAAQHVTDLWKLKAGHDVSEAEKAFKIHMDALEVKHTDSAEEIDGQVEENKKPVKRKTRLLLSYALLLFIIISGGLFLWVKETKPSDTIAPQVAEVSTRPGSRTKVVLPDSSIVWLNAGSKLKYDHSFGQTNRNTTLTGEAFFDVKKASIPFIIYANGIRIKVLGTAFNVKSYPNEKTTETSLIRGRVEITIDKRPGELFILKPNEKLIVANDLMRAKPDDRKKLPIVVLSEVTHSSDNLVLETLWVENKLIFHDESFEEVARKMERWYGVKINITDDRLAQLHVGGGPFENETIEQALKALQIAFDFNFTFKDNNINITR